MSLDFDIIEQWARQAKSRTGELTFACETLGLFEGFDTTLEGPLKTMMRQRAMLEQTENPGLIDKFIGVFSGDAGAGIQSAHASRSADTFWSNVKVLTAEGYFRRAVADLNDREIAVLSASCANALAHRDNTEAHEEFQAFFIRLNAQLVWAGGRGQFIPSEQASQFPAEGRAAADMARELMRRLIIADHASYEQEIGAILGTYVQASQHPDFAVQHPESARAIANVLDPSSAAWGTADDIANGYSPFKGFEAGTDLLIGQLVEGNTAYPIGFNGNESLVTVAQPGAGKTQCHVLPNLLTYDGSMVVLDPKLELLELSAGHRQAEGKRILVLNLADDDLPTHRFNLMEFIDRRPEFLWNGVIELAEFLLPELPHANNPVFRAKAAELFATCLGGIIVEADTEDFVPTLSMAISKLFDAPDRMRNFLIDTSTRAELVECAPLMQSAEAFNALLKNSDTVEDFQRFQANATAALNKYRGGIIDRVANGPGDWTPEDLRQEGTTLYIRIPYEEMTVYGGFVRMVLYTLIKRLRKAKTEQSNLPITFMLDEVAQLGNLDAITNVVETGRGFGLRAWMFLQDYDQARAATNKPNLILKTPKVRLFMNPSLETARDISAELGKLNQVITGQEKPLVEPAALMGEQFAHDILVLSSGTRPLRLRKYMAWQEDEYEALTSKPYTFIGDTKPVN